MRMQPDNSHSTLAYMVFLALSGLAGWGAGILGKETIEEDFYMGGQFADLNGTYPAQTAGFCGAAVVASALLRSPLGSFIDWMGRPLDKCAARVFRAFKENVLGYCCSTFRPPLRGPGIDHQPLMIFDQGENNGMPSIKEEIIPWRFESKGPGRCVLVTRHFALMLVGVVFGLALALVDNFWGFSGGDPLSDEAIRTDWIIKICQFILGAFLFDNANSLPSRLSVKIEVLRESDDVLQKVHSNEGFFQQPGEAFGQVDQQQPQYQPLGLGFDNHL